MMMPVEANSSPDFCSSLCYFGNNDPTSDSVESNTLHRSGKNSGANTAGSTAIPMNGLRRMLTVLCLATLAVQADQTLDAEFDRDVLVVIANQFACHRFDIYLARTHAQQVRGLMFVRDLPAMTGMLFIYEGDDYRSIWMKNTYIPLDIVFARADGTVSSIVRNARPLTLESNRSTEHVRFVLEVNGGMTDKLAIGEGSTLLWQPRN